MSQPITIEDVRIILTQPGKARLAVVKVLTSEPGLYGVGCATFTQRFIVEYMRRFDWREHVNRLNEVYRNRRDTMVRALEEEMPAEVTWSEPKGGLFLWATLPDPLDTTELLAEATRDERVAFVPGRGAFLNGDGARSMRLNFSGASEPMIAEGIARLGRSVARQLELARQLVPDS